MAVTFTDMLNQWNDAGVFSYVIPIILIFAVVFAILEKTGVLNKKTHGADGKATGHEENRGVSAIIALAVAFLSIQFDFVPIFFAQIFPNFGIGLSIVLVILLLLGLVDRAGDAKYGGWIVAAGIFIWTLFNWGDWFGGGYTLAYWFQDNFSALLGFGAVLAVLFIFVLRKDK